MENYPEFPSHPFGSPPPEKPVEPPLYNRFLQAGKEGKNDWWRYLVGILLTFFAGYSIVGAIPLIVLIVRGIVTHQFTLEQLQANELNAENPEFLGVSSNVLLASLLFIFVAGMFFLWVSVRFVHQKRFLSIVNYEGKKFDFKRFFLAAGLWLLVSIVLLLIFYKLSGAGDLQLVFEPGPFIGSLIICLIFLPIQTGWEELFLRGYLFQGIGLWLKSPVWPVLITSVIFGLLHMANAEVKAHGVAEMLPQYILPGVMFGLIAALDERLELAWGLHFANNLFGILTVSSPDMSVQANSIWKTSSIGGLSEFAVGIIPMVLIILFFWKKYKWDFQKLYRKY